MEIIMQPIKVGTRKVGDSVTVFDVCNGWGDKAEPTATGIITKITKKFIHLNIGPGSWKQRRFHAPTGQMVGFRFPDNALVINPQTCG